MMKKGTKFLAILFAMMFMLSSGTVNSYASGINTAYSLRQIPESPPGSVLYQSFYFNAASTVTTMRCTQNTTSGANVTAISTNGISGFLDVAGASLSVNTIIGDEVAAAVSLSVPTAGYYTGYGTIKN